MSDEREKVSGPEGHRDEETRWKQRKEAYELHTFGDAHGHKWSLRELGDKFNVAHSVIKKDIEYYQQFLRNNMPQTFEAWQMRLYQEYEELKQDVEQVLAEAKPGSLVKVQAIKLKVDLLTKIEALFGVGKAVKPPDYGEADAPDRIKWE